MLPNMLLAPSAKEHVRRLASFPHRGGVSHPLNVLLVGFDEGIEGWSEDYPQDVIFTVSKKELEGASCVKADGASMPFVDNSFDVVVVQSVLTVWYAECFRVLKPNGCDGMVNSAYFHMCAMPTELVLKQLVLLPTPENTKVGCAPFILVGTKEA